MDFKNIAKWKVLVGIWVLLLIPFFVANSMFFPYISGKNFAFRIIVEMVFAVWLYLAFADIKYRPRFSWLLGAVGLFVIVMGIADIFAVAPMKALWSNFERMDGWITLIHLLMLMVVMGSVMKTEKMWLCFFRSSLMMSVVMSTYVLKEWLSTGDGRVSVTLGNPIYVAVYFLFNFFFALILLYKDVIVKSEGKNNFKIIFKDWLTYIYLTSTFLCGWGIWRTATRGVILGLIGGLVVSSVFTAVFEKKDKIMKKNAVGGIIIIFILIVGFFVIKDTQFVKDDVVLNRLSAISWNNVSGQGQARQYVWPMAIKGFQEKPILGWGQDGFNYVFNKYYDPRMYGQEQWFDRAHNMPLDVLVAGGVLGLASYLFIFVAALWIIWKRRNLLGVTDGALLVGLLAGYFFQNLFVFDNLISYMFFFFVLSYIYSRDVENDVPVKNEREGLGEENLNYIVLPIICITLFVSLWYVNIRPLSANIYLIKGMQGYQDGAGRNLEYFKKALSYNTFANPEIREQLLSLTPRVYSSNSDAKLKQDFADLTVGEMDRQIKQTPNDARYQLFTGTFLKNMGQYKLAKPYLEKAVELSPTKQTMLFELITDISLLGEKERALELAKKTYELDKNFGNAKDYYIASLILNNDMKTVKELMGGVFTTTSDVIIRAYLMRASEFMQRGDKNSAVFEVQNAIKIAPTFKEQGEGIIQSIWKGEVR
ncbi:MAG: O-antigen ligase family protein [Candidatus Paceibacterota bacterium]|jgi:O-antigen ligase